MEIPSLKKQIINEVYAFMATEALKGNYLILITAAGTILGKPVFDTEAQYEDLENGRLNDKNAVALTFEMIDESKKQYKKYIPDGSPIPGNDGYIMLKDVTVRANDGVRLNFSTMIVFYDQIIGVTFGNASKEPQ